VGKPRDRDLPGPEPGLRARGRGDAVDRRGERDPIAAFAVGHNTRRHPAVLPEHELEVRERLRARLTHAANGQSGVEKDGAGDDRGGRRGRGGGQDPERDHDDEPATHAASVAPACLCRRVLERV